MNVLRDSPGQRLLLGRSLAATRALHEGEAGLAARWAGFGRALLTSPYWAERLRGAGLMPGDLGRPGALESLPMTSRAELRAHWEAMACDHPDLGEAVVVKSSGSTGEPVPVLKDRYDCLHMWAVLRFWCERLGVVLGPEPSVALLCTLPEGLEYEVRAPILADARVTRISTRRPEPLRRLAEAGPAVLSTDPAGLHWLTGRAPVLAPVVVLTSAQTLSPAQRREFEAHTPAPLINYYACTESGPIAWECHERTGTMHVLSPDVNVESVDGELVVTRLRSSVLPVVRYQTGDRGRVVRGACGCGHVGASIEGFEGRHACYFEVPGGRRVDAWSLAPLFKHHDLHHFQLTQTGAERFELSLLGARDVEALRVRVEERLRDLGWATPRVELGPAAAGDTWKPRCFALDLDEGA